MVVASGPREARPRLVASGALGHLLEHGHFVDTLVDAAEVGSLERGFDLVKERVDGRRADALQHRADVGVGVGYERHGSSGAG